MCMFAVNVYVCCKVVHFTKESVGAESLLEPVSRGHQTARSVSPGCKWASYCLSLFRLIFATTTLSSDKSCLLCLFLRESGSRVCWDWKLCAGDVCKDDVRVFYQIVLIEAHMFMPEAVFVLHWAPALQYDLCMSECQTKFYLICI